MAEAVLFNIAQGILANLGSSAVKTLIRETGLLGSLKEDAEGLQRTISAIKAVLLDAEEKQANNNQLKDWLLKLKDAVYDADDLLDDFSTEAQRRQLMPGNKLTKEVRLFFSTSNNLAYGFKMAPKLKHLKRRLDQIAEDRQKFRLEERPDDRQNKNRKSEDSHAVMREVFIGREKDKELITDHLLNSHAGEKLSVVAVIGIGGMGKTALAQSVFNDKYIQGAFDVKIWTCISDNFDNKTVIRKILEAVTRSNVEDLQMDTLVSKLMNEINGKKFLLVLDDVWNEDREKWLDLENILKCGATGSEILVTARAKKVAIATGATLVHSLQGLNDDESWTLFKNIAFGHSCEPPNENFTNIGKEILQKCSGVPLVIRTIGSLLYFQDSETKWSRFHYQELAKIDQEAENKIMETLSLSYMYLPSHLKHCFAYCSLFPKDHWIDVDRLVKMWIAHGFVKLGNKLDSLEEEGNDYFEDLYQRGFFQELKEGPNIYRLCKMHDLIHDLATNVAGVECATLSHKEESLDERPRHLSLNFMLDTWDVSFRLARVDLLRTFLLPGQHNFVNRPQLIVSADLFLKLRSLRVLDLHGLGLEVLPKSIGKLKHLRYLDISTNKFKSLPNSLSKLTNLQTLNLFWCRELEELPRDLRKMVNLRHLDIKYCDELKYMPRGLGSLTSLQSLSQFVVDVTNSKYNDSFSEMKNLNNLKGDLEIKNLGHDLQSKLDFETANLKEKKGLEGLTLKWKESTVEEAIDEFICESISCPSNLEELKIKNYMSSRFPRWMMDSIRMTYELPNIRSIKLYECRRCKGLPRFEQLRHLKSLSLFYLSELEYIDEREREMVNVDTFFPSLEKLQILHLPELKGWWRETETDTVKKHHLPSFPRLSYLSIINCPKLKSMPSGPPTLKALHLDAVTSELVHQQLMDLSGFTSLKQLTIGIDECRNVEIEKYKKGGEHWGMISHIPIIVINTEVIQYLDLPSTDRSTTKLASHPLTFSVSFCTPPTTATTSTSSS